MKPILYLSAALMISASIYGFADYKKTTRNADFKALYDKKEVTGSETPTEKENTGKMTEPPVTTEVAAPVKNLEKEKLITKKTMPKKTAHSALKNSNVKKQKKLNTKLFSRAPLKEYPIEETPNIKKTGDEKVKSKE